MKTTVTKHTHIKLTRKEVDTFISDKISEICPDLDKIEVVFNVQDAVVTGADIYSKEEE